VYSVTVQSGLPANEDEREGKRKINMYRYIDIKNGYGERKTGGVEVLQEFKR
jgi:hypothetical protein